VETLALVLVGAGPDAERPRPPARWGHVGPPGPAPLGRHGEAQADGVGPARAGEVGGEEW
jgi:hypothetical protein